MADLKEAFRRLGLSESAAGTAAEGRPAPVRPVRAPADPVPFLRAAARPTRRLRAAGVTIPTDAQGRTSSEYALVRDGQNPSTWRWPLTKDDGSAEWDPALVDTAIGAFQNAGLSDAETIAVVAQLRWAWARLNRSPDDMPVSLNLENLPGAVKPVQPAAQESVRAGLEAAARSLGLSEAGVAAFVEGRR